METLGVDLPLLGALALLALFSWMAVTWLVTDKQDTLIRALRTAVQSALGLLLATMTSGELDASIGLNVVTPAIVTFSTVIHAAIQPAEKEATT